MANKCNKQNGANPLVRINAYLPDALVTKAKQFAETENITLTQLLRDGLRIHLATLQKTWPCDD